MNVHEYYMRRALRLARKGEGWASPNPMVGAVIVKDGRIIGEGYHACCGENHAEVNAILQAKESIAGATVYVTLEPCSHHGKTPPCVKALIEQKPALVVIGSIDPNPLVAGRGIAALQNHGIAIIVGILEGACRQLNEKFIKYITTGYPFITLKYAQTLDGRIATKTGHSQWISSLPARRFAHRLRGSHDAILIGIGTVQSDDPELTVRLARGRNPLRLVLDSRLNISPQARILQHQDEAKTMIITSKKAAPEKLRILKDMGVETIIAAETAAGKISLPQLFAELGSRGVSSVLIEGGAAVITSIIQDKLSDRLVVILAPKIVGSGVESVGDLGFSSMEEALPVHDAKVKRLGPDLLWEGRIG